MKLMSLLALNALLQELNEGIGDFGTGELPHRS